MHKFEKEGFVHTSPLELRNPRCRRRTCPNQRSVFLEKVCNQGESLLGISGSASNIVQVGCLIQLSPKCLLGDKEGCPYTPGCPENVFADAQAMVRTARLPTLYCLLEKIEFYSENFFPQKGILIFLNQLIFFCTRLMWPLLLQMWRFDPSQPLQ